MSCFAQQLFLWRILSYLKFTSHFNETLFKGFLVKHLCFIARVGHALNSYV